MKKLFCFILLVGVFACNKTPLPIAPETGEEDAYSPRAAKYALSSVPSFPELMTPENVMAHIEANGITSVDSFLMALPPFHRRHYIAMFRSKSPARDVVTSSHPRIVSWGADADFIITWLTDPDTDFSDSIEFLHHRLSESKWVAGMIDFSVSPPELSEPAACQTCHGNVNKPLWGFNSEGSEVSGAFRTEEIYNMMRTSDSPRLNCLDNRERYDTVSPLGYTRNSAITIDEQGGDGNYFSSPYYEIAINILKRHTEIAFANFKERADYLTKAEEFVCGGEDYYEAHLHTYTFMDPTNHHPGKISGTGQFIGGSSGNYYRANEDMDEIFMFLVMHDLYLNDDYVKATYRAHLNTAAFGGNFEGNFKNNFYTYQKGSARVEDELLALYRDNFELKLNEGMQAMFNRPVNGLYRFTPLDSHVRGFASKVCGAIRADRDNPPPSPVTLGAVLPEITIGWKGYRDDFDEGEDAEFKLKTERALAETITVSLSVSETGNMIKGTPATTVIFPKDAKQVIYSVATVDDRYSEPNSAVTATIEDGSGYTVGEENSATLVGWNHEDRRRPRDPGLPPPPDTTFDIELVYNSGVSENDQALVQAAANRWEKIITGELSDVGDIDDVKVTVKMGNVQGDAAAGAQVLTHREGTNLPLTSEIVLQTGRTASANTILHEMGHALGIGIWSAFVQDIPGRTEVPQKHFTGAKAIAAFNTAGGEHYDALPKIPLGLNGWHWSHTVMEGELMSDMAGGTAISAITVQALADLGYTVNVSAADDYDIPLPTISIIRRESGEVDEGEDALFIVTANRAPLRSTAVTLSVSESGDMIDGTPGTSVTFSSHANGVGFTVRTDDDSDQESNSVIRATVKRGDGYIVGPDSTVTITARDNDAAPPPLPVITISGGSGINEGGTAQFTITADKAPGDALTVSLSVSETGDMIDGTPGSSVTISQGSRSQSFSVSTDDDSTDEDASVITVTIGSGSGYTVGTSGSASVTVEDDDVDLTSPPRSISIDNYVAVADSTFTADVSNSRRGSWITQDRINIRIADDLSIRRIDWYLYQNSGRIQLRKTGTGNFTDHFTNGGDQKLFIVANGKTVTFSPMALAGWWSNWGIDDEDNQTVMNAIRTGDTMRVMIGNPKP